MMTVWFSRIRSSSIGMTFTPMIAVVGLDSAAVAGSEISRSEHSAHVTKALETGSMRNPGAIGMTV
jgi:hypothetical protein